MSYTKQNFKSGDILYASQLNAMDNEISTLEAEVNSTKNMVGHPYTATTASAMSDQTKIYVYTGSETGYTAGHWYYHNGTAWTDGGVYNSVAVNTDTSLTVSGQAADSKAVGDAIDDLDSDITDLKGSLDDTNDFLRANGYDTRLVANSEIIDGYYTSANRTDGNYGYYRSTENLIPLQDLNVVIDGTLPANAIYTVQAYDANGGHLRGRLVNTAISSNNLVIQSSNVTAQYDDIAFVRINFLVYDSTSNTFARLNNSVEVYPYPNVLNVSENVTNLLSAVSDMEANIGAGKLINFSEQTLYASGGYIKNDGTIGSANAHGVISFPVSTGKFNIIFDIPQDTGISLGVVKDSLGAVVQTIERQHTYYSEDVCRTVNLPDGKYTVYLNWFNMNRANDYYDSVILQFSEDTQTVFDGNLRKQYFHSVRKPFDFNGKTAVFIGDSITRGATGASTMIDSIYPSLFCQKVGMTYTNVAVSGAGFTKSDTTYKIITQLQNAVKDTDYVFIAGGVNDYLDGADMATFKTAVQTAIDYVLANFTGEIIFITPINTARESINHYGFKMNLADYCDAITELIMQNNIDMRISIVQGWLFGFPTEESSTDMITAMFGDTLHPTELGYKSLYVSGLLNALC